MSKIFYIPSIGDQIVLDRDWQVTITNENRNRKFIKKVFDSAVKSRLYLETIPANTILQIERIYIRKGKKDFDSVTFKIVSCPDQTYDKHRFWVSLKTCNDSLFFHKNS